MPSCILIIIIKIFLQPFAANSDLFDAEIDNEPEEGNGIIIEEGEQQEDGPLDGGELENNIINDEDDCARNFSDGEEEDTTKEDKKIKKIRVSCCRHFLRVKVIQRFGILKDLWSY